MKILPRPTFEEELLLWNKGINHVIGIDEVGRGAFAGPIVAAGVVFHRDTPYREYPLGNVNDSKLLSPTARRQCAKIIKDTALFWTVESIEISFINRFGIGKANASVFRKVIKKLLLLVNHGSYVVLIDGFHQKYLPGGIHKQKAIIKGDQKSISIAAASIIAKVYRDEQMRKTGRKYPDYSFGVNKGYGTKSHQEMIRKYGLSKIHRRSFHLEKFLMLTS